MEKIKRLLLENKAWAQGQIENDQDYFLNMAKDQSPDILWIGCADSRVPPNVVVNVRPGDLFVHRNIANLVNKDDENLMSVIEYGVLFLKVKYIIVCGHYNCGGVKAAFDGIENKRISNWTKSLSELKDKNKPTDPNNLVEISVCDQIEKLKKLPAIIKAWEDGPFPILVGWVYDLKTGLLKEMSKFDISEKKP
ncbi:MAG: carbonic anhydrase [Bacteriovoracales bacterium]